MTQSILLTPQQQAVVNHNTGPALVFAVAGAGKTTAMVQRIERLVRDGIFAPAEILATSFGRANVQDLRQALRPFPHCHPVDIRTLHSLGRRVIEIAQQQGHVRHLRLNPTEETTGYNESHRLLNLTVAAAFRHRLPFAHELNGLDRDDFLDYVSFCKGNLYYANLTAVPLPAEFRQIARPAPPPANPLGWYVDLYALFEEIRQEQGIVTFDDMLLTGWELLVRYPDVLAQVNGRYRCIVVDEFQDINLVQSEMLHLLAQPHGNYMAVGDDDQTIYEWRGAAPRFILEFSQRYQAQTYLISENFRCPATPLTLANGVIRHNQKREPKQLRLTRGFWGETAVFLHPDVFAMSQHMVRQMQSHHAQGTSWQDMAVLVRLNAQTPPLEQELIAQNIPYRVSQPFYARPEIQTLVNYGRIAWLEQELRQGKRPLTGETAQEKILAAWRDICNRPKRYLSANRREQIGRAILRQTRPVSLILDQFAADVEEEWQADTLLTLADDLAWLGQNLAQPAQAVLTELDLRLGYRQFLRTGSGFAQTGEGRAAGVTSFLAYAKQYDTLTGLMTHLRQLPQTRQSQLSDNQPAVTVTTIHKAKGREWPVVWLAQCNETVMPFSPERTADVEEERRLFYVALTRTRQHLYLHLTAEERPSRFLQESRWQQVLPAMAAITSALAQDPAGWSATQALALARAVPEWGLESFFQAWWRVSAEQREGVVAAMVRFYTAVGRQNLLPHLRLKRAEEDWWRGLCPETVFPPADDFPGLAALRGQKS